MDPVTNPFRPGAGRRPPVLAGREDLLNRFEVILNRVDKFGEGDRSWILNGLRGVGKTVLLTELLAQADDRKWITVKVEAVAGISLATLLARGLTRSMRAATGRHPQSRLRRALAVFRAFTLKVDPQGGISLGVEVEPERGVADSGRFAEDLASLLQIMGETARDLGIGVLVLVDELQEAAPADLMALNTAIHELGQAESPLPVHFVGAGLPSLPALLADATSYAERLYDYQPVGLLDSTAAEQALTAPTEARGVGWEPHAVRLAVEQSAGYPYFIQSIGKHVWDYGLTTVISSDDVKAGLQAAQEEVDAGLYRSRWERATPWQQDLLRSLATLGGDGSIGIADLAFHLQRRTTDLSVARKELIRKGLVFSPVRGQLAFTVPGMARFIQRQP
jgi:AAA ATPase domain